MRKIFGKYFNHPLLNDSWIHKETKLSNEIGYRFIYIHEPTGCICTIQEIKINSIQFPWQIKTQNKKEEINNESNRY